MKNVLRLFKNKFLLATAIFFVYSLFLDENDIFTMISQSRKLSKLEAEKETVRQDLLETQKTIKKLERPSEIERYAREEKLFKKDDEDVFVIFYE